MRRRTGGFVNNLKVALEVVLVQKGKRAERDCLTLLMLGTDSLPGSPAASKKRFLLHSGGSRGRIPHLFVLQSSGGITPSFLSQILVKGTGFEIDAI